MNYSRRETLSLLGLSGLGIMVSPALILPNLKGTMMKRSIPSSGELLPVIGLGTWQTFDVGSSESQRKPLCEVLKEMKKLGGKMIDSSPMYRTSEKVVGDLTNELDIQDSFFYATKVWTDGKDSGIQQMQESMRKMRRKAMDLMQIHNLVDWRTHLKTLRDWREQGKIRYIGITHYMNSAHSELERVIKSEEDIDFVQLNYSIRSRHAERSLLDMAMDNQVAVIINRPYESGSLFRITKGKEIPIWVKEWDINSWGQFFLKFILSHPAVTCIIPGTSKPHHLVDNMQAGYGRLPDGETRVKMARFVDEL